MKEHRITGLRIVLWLCALALLTAISAARSEEAGEYALISRGDGTAEITGWIGGAAQLTIPDAIEGQRVTAIGAGAFAYQNDLERVQVPEGIASLGDGAFADCQELAEITLPGTLETIGENPFAGCENLKRIDLAEGQEELTVVNGVLFGDAQRRLIFYPRILPMDRYTVPETVERIDARAFYYCNRLISVTLPAGVMAIGEDAFGARANLTLVVERGSYAEQYARENDIKYTYPDAQDWLTE